MDSRSAVARMFRYRQIARECREAGIRRIYSSVFAEKSGASPEQVRKDFSLFGVSGRKKAGYDVDALLVRMDELFGAGGRRDVVVVGAGNLGAALLKYRGFEKERIRIAASFDIDPSKQRRSGPVPVLPVAEIPSFVGKHGIAVGIICVPASGAQEACDLLVLGGIRGILNFAPVGLRVPSRVVVKNMNIAVELESLLYSTRCRESAG
jgi:redox-sensing transcriptional repressor